MAATRPLQSTVPLMAAFMSPGSDDCDGSIIAYARNFGDGDSSDLANPSHVYLTAGVYSAPSP